MLFPLPSRVTDSAYRVRNPFLKLQVNSLPNFHLMMLHDAHQGIWSACLSLVSRQEVTISPPFTKLHRTRAFLDITSSKTPRVTANVIKLCSKNKFAPNAFSSLVSFARQPQARLHFGKMLILI